MVLDPVQYEFSLASGNDDWRVRRVEMHEGISEIYHCSIELARKGDAPAVMDELVGGSCKLRIHRGDSLERYVNGIISRVTDRGVSGQPAHARITVDVVPALWALSRRSTARMFQGMKIPDIVTQVIKDGVEPFQRVAPTQNFARGDYPVRDYCMQWDETDLDFVMRLLQEEGISFYFEHPEDGKETITLADAKAKFITKGTPDLDAVADETLFSEFTPTQRVSTGKVWTFDYNWKKAMNVVADSFPKKDAANKLETYDPTEKGEFPDGDNRILQAQICQEIETAHANQNTGVSRIISVLPGQICAVDTEDDDLDGKYLITELRTSGVSTEDLGLESAHVKENEEYENTFVCLSEDIPFRPERTIPRPRVPGYHTAVVVGDDLSEGDGGSGADAEKDIWNSQDPYGRVRVRFMWDQVGKYSCWIRVAQMWAGSKFGSWFMPRTGMEVAVLYRHGDPDKPLIMGCMYNGVNHPPLLLEPEPQVDSNIATGRQFNEPELSGFITASTDGAEREMGGSNQLIFDDSKNREEVWIRAQKNMNTVVQNNQTVVVGDKPWTQAERDFTSPEGPAGPWKATLNIESQQDSGAKPAKGDGGGNRTVFLGAGARGASEQPDLWQTAVYQMLSQQNRLNPDNPDPECVRRDPGGGNDWLRVMGNQRIEIRGNRCRIVGDPSAEGSGNEFVEVFGERRVKVHKSEDINIGTLANPAHQHVNFIGNKSELVVGFTSSVHLGSHVRLSVGFSSSQHVGPMSEIFNKNKATLNRELTLTHKIGAEYEWKENDGLELADGDLIKKSRKKLILVGGCSQPAKKMLKDKAKADKAKALATLAGWMTMPEQTHQAEKLIHMAEMMEQKMYLAEAKNAAKAAIKAAKDAEKTGQLILEEKKAALSVQKSSMMLDPDKIEIVCTNHKITLNKHGDIRIDSGKDVMVTGNTVRLKGKINHKSFTVD